MSTTSNVINLPRKLTKSSALQSTVEEVALQFPVSACATTHEPEEESAMLDNDIPIDSKCSLQRYADFAIWYLTEQAADIEDKIGTHIFDWLTEDEMDRIFPVQVVDTSADSFFAQRFDNWLIHTSHYQIALDWFLDKVEAFQGSEGDDCKYGFAQHLYASLDAKERVILQRGFEITVLYKYGPRVDGTLYHIELELNPAADISEWIFPVMRKSIGPEPYLGQLL